MHHGQSSLKQYVPVVGGNADEVMTVLTQSSMRLQTFLLEWKHVPAKGFPGNALTLPSSQTRIINFKCGWSSLHANVTFLLSIINNFHIKSWRKTQSRKTPFVLILLPFHMAGVTHSCQWAQLWEEPVVPGVIAAGNLRLWQGSFTLGTKSH